MLPSRGAPSWRLGRQGLRPTRSGHFGLLAARTNESQCGWSRSVRCRMAPRVTPMSIVRWRPSDARPARRRALHGDVGHGHVAPPTVERRLAFTLAQAASSARGMSTRRARRYSPRLFACGSLRVDAATPSPSRPWTTKLTLSRFGSGWRSTSSGARLRHELAEPLDREVALEPRVRGGVPHPDADVGVAALVAGARAADACRAARARSAPAGRRRESAPTATAASRRLPARDRRDRDRLAVDARRGARPAPTAPAPASRRRTARRRPAAT